jgi:ABC-type polar amino acid transport system ATPase subunit
LDGFSDVRRVFFAECPNLIIVSHEMSFVRRAATRIVMMNGGIVTEELRDFHAADLSNANGIGAYLRDSM